MKIHPFEITKEALEKFEEILKKSEALKSVEVSKAELVILYKLHQLEKLLVELNERC
jgi:hypothetical protein